MAFVGIRRALLRPKLFLDGRADLAAIYSLRQLNSRYRGPLVRLRRSSDNAEQDFGAGRLWVRWAEVLLWLAGANAYVSAWYDQSGLSRDLAQATASAQPLLGLLSNGLPGMTFDGSNDCLRTAAFALPQPWAFNIAYRRVSLVQIDYENVFDGITGDRGTLYMAHGSNSSNSMYANGTFTGDAASVIMPVGTRGVIGGTFNGASAIMELSAASIASATGNPGTNNIDGFTLGAMGSLDPTRFSNIEVQEWVAFNTAHTSAQLKADNAAMRSAWGF